jgi:mercuric reductase
VINTDPQVARIGLGEAEGWQKGVRAKSMTLPLSSLATAVVGGHTEGLIKLVAEAGTERLVVHIAPHADELINAAAMALKGGLTLVDLQNMLFAAPTISAAFRLTARSFFRARSEELPCCGD